MVITRANYQLGKYVMIEVKDFGHGNVEVVLSQKLYINNLLTKKDYILPLQRWQQLMFQIDDLQTAVDEHKNGKDIHFNYHLGRNNFVQVNSGFQVVDLRQFWLPEGTDRVQPTRKGIALKFDEFDILVKLKPEIEQVIPELDQMQPCWMSDDHRNQEGLMNCRECNPNQNW
jgi:hypothetical protein